MAINIQALRGEIYKKYGTAKAFSQQIQWNQNKIGKILKNAYIPDIEECAVIADALNMDTKKFHDIFVPCLSPNGDKPCN